MKAGGMVRLYFHSFFASGIDVGERTASRFRRFTPRYKTLILRGQWLVGPSEGRSVWQRDKSLTLPASKPGRPPLDIRCTA